MTGQKRSSIITLVGILALALAVGGGTSLAGSCSGSGATQANIVSTAIEAGSFDTLVAAVKAADLVDALSADGPLTVFAPTDEAFAKLPEGTLESLLEPENKALLRSILTYHVAPGRLTADQVVQLDRVQTLNGQRPAVTVADGGVMVGKANVTATDIMTSNGVIHVIDEVLLPAEERSATTGAAQKLIGMAIDRGVPLYNHGQAAACAAVYEVAAQGLIASQGMGLSAHDRRTLEIAMADMHSTRDASRQAWIMREALDDVMQSLGETEIDGPMSSNRR